MHRFPEATAADINDFRRSNWRDAIAAASHQDYPSMWQTFSEAARVALENGDASQGKVLWLLAEACSMTLKPLSINEPLQQLKGTSSNQGSRLEVFQEADVTLLAQISEEVTEPWLQARLADLAWILMRPRSPRHALIAIDAYRSIPLNVETWLRGGKDCWERAINLTRTLRAASGERIKEIETAIINIFTTTTEDDGSLSLWLSDLLFANGLGKEECTAIAERLRSLAQIVDGRGNFFGAREFFAAAAKWFKRSGDETQAADATVEVAEGWAKEAAARTSSEKPSYAIAASFYENAIQTYRTIPRIERARHKVEERIAELHLKMSAAGNISLGEMGVFTSPTIDITEIVESARSAVTGKNVPGALLAFSNIHRGCQVERLRKQAEAVLKKHPLQALFSAAHLSRDGRVIAKRPGMAPGTDGYQAAVWAQMIKNFGLELGLGVQGRIWPALEVITLEHRLRESDFILITGQSPIVPIGREQLFGKALFAGYERDFTVALHLLVPQMENMIRFHLKAAGVKTTNLDKDGIENEYGLSTLMELPEVVQIFGQDVAFEIKALFCDPLGPNLRNELAHGLLGDEDCDTQYSIYAWWLGLKLVFNTFWNSLRSAGTQEDTSDELEVD